MDNHWNVTTSSGRRVSLLCDDGSSDYASSYASSSMSPTPPLSPDYRRPYAPIRTDSIGSASSSSSLSSGQHSLYSPATPPSVSLPPLDKMVPLPTAKFYPPLPGAVKFEPPASPVLDPALMHDGSLSPTTHLSRQSSPTTSPRPAVANPVLKRTSRRYTCRCGKSFTTSGHLARHTRIHTGEKNYVCPEAGCGARFSRQDNCMQHYRTHQSGSNSKRASRKRRVSEVAVPASSPAAPAAAAVAEPSLQLRGAAAYTPQVVAPACYQVVNPALYPEQPFPSAIGLDALAKVACSGF